MTWAHPYVLLLLPILAAGAWLLWRGKAAPEAVVRFSALTLVTGSGRGGVSTPTPRIRALRLLALALLVLALARPQTGISQEQEDQRGIDIMLCLDTSYSMMAEDFRPNRLGVAKDVVRRFVQGRPNDRIGLVVFAGDAFSICPLTLDHRALLEFLDQVTQKTVGTDGTAMGNALATCVNRLSASTSPSKIVVLITDGRNNTGEVAPLAAAELAKARGIRIYTIGVGVQSSAPLPIRDDFGMIRYVRLEDSIDEEGLLEIASATGGKFFRATDNRGLEAIFSQIDRLEKAPLPATRLSRVDRYGVFLWPALGLILLEVLLGSTLWRQIP